MTRRVEESRRSAESLPKWIEFHWLVSARYDLGFFIASCLLTWLFLGLYWWLATRTNLALSGTHILVVYFVFTALFDHPHIFQTFSRTHRDPTEFQRHRVSHTWGLGAFIVLGLGIHLLGYEQQLIVFAAFWGSFHIVRQHWGFLRAYQTLGGEAARSDRIFDGLFFYGGMLAFLLRDYVGVDEATPIYGNLSVTFPYLPEYFAPLTLIIFGLISCGYAAHLARKVAQGRALNGSKLLLIAAALGTHGMVFFFTATPFLVAEALETAYHNVQYQGFVAHYQRRRFGASRIAWKWFGLATLYGLLVGSVEMFALTHEHLSWVFTPFSMVVLYHYWVDGKIWKLSSTPELKDALLRRPQPILE